MQTVEDAQPLTRQQPIPARTTLRGIAQLCPLAVIILVFVVTGVIGIDFGDPWDERGHQIEPVQGMIRTGLLLPQRYEYPSVNYWINLTSSIPEVIRTMPAEIKRTKDVEAWRERAARGLDPHSFLLRLRLIYILIASLTILWTYLAVLRWLSSWPAATFAAALVGTSWEVAYHARYVATDCVVMQFAALTMLCVVFAVNSPAPRLWLRMGAVAAGLTAGTKYPGGLVLIPVLVAAWQSKPAPERRSVSLAGLIATFTATVLISTPGIVLQPLVFLADADRARRHYALGHGGHTVAGGISHLAAMGSYFSSVFFSRYVWGALVVTGLIAVGAMLLIRRERRMALLLLSFPVIYALYFSRQNAMLVRNYLALAPYLAAIAAFGALMIFRLIDERGRAASAKWGRVAAWSLCLLLITVPLVNAAWLFKAASAIADPDWDRAIRLAVDAAAQEPETRFYISPRLARHVSSKGVTFPPNVATDPSQADRAMFYAREAFSTWIPWPANDRKLTVRTFGPAEVNFNYYPGWWGRDRIVDMEMSRVRAMKPMFLE